VIHAYPSVIHQNVELAKVVHGALYERGDFGFLLHVRFDEHDVAATSRDLCGDALATLDITIGKDTCAPSAIKRRTVASPIPDAPPVTAATLPLSCPIDTILRCVVSDLVRTNLVTVSLTYMRSAADCVLRSHPRHS